MSCCDTHLYSLAKILIYIARSYNLGYPLTLCLSLTFPYYCFEEVSWSLSAFWICRFNCVLLLGRFSN